MYLNNSRIKELTCPQKFAWKYLQRLRGDSRMALLLGECVHEGLATIQATNYKTGLQAAITKFQNRISETEEYTTYENLLEADTQGYSELSTEIVSYAVALAYEEVANSGIQFVSTEHEFVIPFEESEHNDITAHFIDANGVQHFRHPTYEEIIAGIKSPHATEDKLCPCYRPHSLVCRLDALVIQDGKYYILDYKTHARDDSNYWNQYIIDQQFSLYTLAAEQALGKKIAGVIIVGIYKPSNRQVENWNKKKLDVAKKTIQEYMRSSLKYFPRTREQLHVARRKFINAANEIEWRMLTNNFAPTLSSTTCSQYGRCGFFDICLAGRTDLINPQEFMLKSASEPDYVEKTWNWTEFND